MSERIRNIREALRSGFDTQIAIGEKAFGLAEQRESRNFQMALEARRERLQRELQTERLKAQERLQEDRQEFELGENQRSRAHADAVAKRTQAANMDIRLADNESREKIAAAKQKWEYDSMVIQRVWEVGDNKVEAQQKWKDNLSTYLGTLNDAREKFIEQLAKSDLPEETRSSLTEQLNFVSAQIQQGEKDLGFGLEVIISRLKVDPFVEALAVDEGSIASAKAYLDNPSKETELYKRIEEMVNDSGVEIIGESKDEFIKRVALGVAGSSLDKGAPDAAPTPDAAPSEETHVHPSVSGETISVVGGFLADAVGLTSLAKTLLPSLYGGKEVDPSSLPSPINIVATWKESGLQDAEIASLIDQMIKSPDMPKEQVPLWAEILSNLRKNSAETGMINPRGGLLSQQPMMAMQSDMTQGEIDYFSPDAINARLSGMV
jgi:hypothetical protein